MKPISSPISTLIFANPFQSQISKPFDPSVQSVNSNTNYFYPINLPITQLQTTPIKSQETHASFTFAPLVTAISLPIPPLQTGNFTTQQNQLHTQDQVVLQQPKPTLTPTTTTTMSSVIQDFPNKPNSAVTLKPINKCGITKYAYSRVVGGAITQIGIH